MRTPRVSSVAPRHLVPRLPLALLTALGACLPSGSAPSVFGPPPATPQPAAAGAEPTGWEGGEEAGDGTEGDWAAGEGDEAGDWAAGEGDEAGDWAAGEADEEPPARPGPRTSPAAPAAGALSIAIPADWQAMSGWRVFTREAPSYPGPDRWRTLVRVLPSLPATGDVNQALLQAMRTYLPAELVPRLAPYAYRRYVGDGLWAQYRYAVGPEKGNKDDTWFTIYLVDCGPTWELVEVASIFEPGGVSGPWNIGIREAQETAEPVLATLRCPGSRNQSLFAPSTFARHWYFGSGAAMDYVNVFTGSSWTSSVSYAGDYDLRADGSARYHYSGATSIGAATQFGEQTGAGTWSYQGDILTIAIRGLQPRIYRVATVADFPDGTAAVLIKPELAAMPTAITNPEVVFTTKSTYAE